MIVKIYTMTDAKSAKRQDARVIFTLETQTSKGPADRTWVEEIEGTANEAALLAIIKALEHITMPCDLEIYTESRFIASAFGWLQGWKDNGWKTAKGKDVAHKDEWQQLANLIEGRKVTIHCQEDNSFRKWQKFELERMKNEKMHNMRRDVRTAN